EQEKAKQYGVNAVPAIVVNGKLVLAGKPNREQLLAAGIGQSI
ncbi:thioredoxin family protein, partial [Calothrix sp. HK-06]